MNMRNTIYLNAIPVKPSTPRLVKKGGSKAVGPVRMMGLAASVVQRIQDAVAEGEEMKKTRRARWQERYKVPTKRRHRGSAK